ncbi:MAG: protein kinase [Gemmatimonadales bacterium]
MTESTIRDQLQTSVGTAYTIQRELGGGGMSRVFLARDEALGRDIVIKVLPREMAAEMSAERFTREIKLAAALQHPHVLPVLSAGVSDGLPYYMMPFVRGDSLRVAMDAGAMSFEERVDVLRDVARALRYAHSEGVVHRDIKPENILLSSGSAVVVDFGIAKALSASKTEAPGGTLTLVGASIGTPAYMSPEQAAADPNIDHRSDIYSWGVMAYEFLSGHHPFEGKKTPQQYLAAHLAETPASLTATTPAVPAAIADVVMRAIEKDPDKRQQDADEILTQLGGSGRGTGPGVTVSPKSSRWRIPAISAAVVLILALGLMFTKNRGNLSAASPVMLAVLPFENQGPAEQDYFVDGLTDAVNGKLAGLSGISVIDRRSSSLYKKTTKPVKQIGTELGVQYVLGGVVRWAKTDSTWRAQVMPTLVRTSDATTRWAGEPMVVSSTDPFSAQTEIATKVAGALRIALGSDDVRELAERPTENAEAYDAYLRGKAIVDATVKTSLSVRDIDQAISEFKRAVSLDPKFAQGWAQLTKASYTRAEAVPGDSASLRVAMESAKRAASLDPDDPMVIDIRSAIAFFQGHRKEGIAIVADALRGGLTSPELFVTHAYDLMDDGKLDSAKVMMARALKLNPRFAPTLLASSDLAAKLRDWVGAERSARALIALDPTDERGWAELAVIARQQGDTAGIRKTIEEAFRYIPAPSNRLLVFMVYAGHNLGTRFVRMSPDQLRIETLEDSVRTYYDNKADFYLALGDASREKIYHDSIISKLEGRNLSGPGEASLRLFLANAYAFAGKLPEAQRELDRARASAKAMHQVEGDGTVDMDHRVVAAVLARIGRQDEAIRELRSQIKNSTWTRQGLALEPKLRGLRGNKAFEDFLKEKQ